MDEHDIEEANRKLLTEGDDSIIECHEHNTKCRWGDLDDIGQLAVLSGIDAKTECLLTTCRRDRPMIITSLKAAYPDGSPLVSEEVHTVSTDMELTFWVKEEEEKKRDGT